VQFLVNVKN